MSPPTEEAEPMPFDPDDPRLTAYALGELDDADRSAIEAILRDDPDARAFVQGVEETARLLADEFRHESSTSDGLGDARRDAIERHLAAPSASIPFAVASAPAKARFRSWIPFAAAAGLLGVAGAIFLATRPRDRANPIGDLALNEPAAPAAVAAEPSSWPESGAAPSRPLATAPAPDAALGENAAAAPRAKRLERGRGAELPRPAAPASGPAADPFDMPQIASAPRGDVVAAEAELKRAQDRLDFMTRARSKGYVSEAQKTADESDLNKAKLALKQAKAGAAPGGDPARNRLAGGIGGGIGAGGGMGGMGGMMGDMGGMGMGGPGVGGRMDGRGLGMGSMPGGGGAPAGGPQGPAVAAAGGHIVNPVRDQGLGYRLPVVVGTQGGGVANFTPNVNQPFTQASAAQVTTFNGGPAGGQPLGNPAANNPQMQANANQVQNAPAANPQQQAQLYARFEQNRAMMPGFQQPGQGNSANPPQSQGNSANPSRSQNPGPGQSAQEAGRNFGLATTDGAKPADDNSTATYFETKSKAPMSGNQAQLRSGLLGIPNDQAKPGEPNKPAPAKLEAEHVAQSAPDNFAFRPAAPAPPAAAMPAPEPAAQGEQKGKAVFEALHDLDKNVVLKKAPSAVTANEKGTLESAPAQPPAEGQKDAALGRDARPDLAQQPGQKAVEARPAATPEALAASRPAQEPPARPPVQLALADREAQRRLAEVSREVDAKQAELRQLTERAEGLARKLDREQTRVDRESYARFYDHPFQNVLPGNELSTFSIDVDTGAYANVRRFLAQGQLPPPDAVRIEEMLNYFRYDDPAPKGDEPFSVNCEVAACPWDAGHRVARIGLKGKEIDADKRPTSNLVFLIDVSGSMADLNKLPLLKAGMNLLVDQLTENDRVGIVVYSNETREAFPSTPCHRKAEIHAAIDALRAEGGTNGGAGIQMAYAMAEKNFVKGGTNRVILATDGDFNVGMTKDQLLANSEARAKSGVFLTVLGFGEGNLQDDFMEQLADKGNGHYRYIDTIDEARKTLVRDLSGTLVTIAKDVKIQVEFNPDRVASYRLIGYENRVMAAQDFRDDKKDAGEIGAGHSVTALYEFVPAGAPAQVAQADRKLKYRRSRAGDAAADKEASPESFTVFLRYKKPDGDAATELSRGVVDDGRDFGRASSDLKFASSVAGFGMLLRGSPYKGSLTYPAVLEIASSALGPDKTGDRKGFLDLVHQAMQAEGVEPVPLAAPAAPR